MTKDTSTSNIPSIKEDVVYQKSDSFLELSGAKTDPKQLLRLKKLQANIANLPSGIQNVVKQACDDALSNKKQLSKTFSLRPHITEEMQHLSDLELPRYLFYRFRYDVYPKTQQLDEYPPCVQIEPTSICNYRCVFCYQTDTKLTQGRHGHMGMMNINTFKIIVDQIQGKVEAVTLASRGEPLMAKDIIPMLEYVSGKFLGFKINTNASFLTEEKTHAILAAEPNTVVFSADASDKDLYAKLRINGNLETVLSNIQRFNEIKTKHYPNSRTITRVSGVRFNKEQNFEKIESFWHNFVDQVAFVAYNPWESAYDAPENKITDHCSDLWRRTFVWWDGLVNPCDVDYRSTLAVGSIKEKSISELWTGNKYQALRHSHSNAARCTLTPCNGCSLV